MRIFILNPILEDQDKQNQQRRKDALRNLSETTAPDVELEMRGLSRGAATMESFYDEYVGMKDIVERALEAERLGYNAVVLNCFMNPALEGLRELLEIPVVGAGEAAIYLASMLGDNFSILDPDPPHRTYSHKIVSSLGLTHKLRSVRYLNLGVEGLRGGFEEILERMVGESVGAVEQDGAHVIVLGCTGMMRYSERLAERMKLYDVPVVEPLTSAINVAVALARLGLRQSKLSYPKPAEKKRLR